MIFLKEGQLSELINDEFRAKGILYATDIPKVLWCEQPEAGKPFKITYDSETGKTVSRDTSPLCFTALEDGSSITLDSFNCDEWSVTDLGNEITLYYSTDNKTYYEWDGATISLNEGDKLYVYGNNPTSWVIEYDEPDNDGIYWAYYVPHFSMSGSIAASGNIMNLISKDCPTTIPFDNAFYAMFYNCESLTTAPELLATMLTTSCYSSMFRGCTSLTTAPELPATTLASSCYNYMFYGCTNLNYVKAMFTTTPSTTYTHNWLSGVSSTGTFIKNTAATWNVSGTSGIPTGWTVETAAA